MQVGCGRESDFNYPVLEGLAVTMCLGARGGTVLGAKVGAGSNAA